MDYIHSIHRIVMGINIWIQYVMDIVEGSNQLIHIYIYTDILQTTKQVLLYLNNMI